MTVQNPWDAQTFEDSPQLTEFSPWLLFQALTQKPQEGEWLLLERRLESHLHPPILQNMSLNMLEERQQLCHPNIIVENPLCLRKEKDKKNSLYPQGRAVLWAQDPVQMTLEDFYYWDRGKNLHKTGKDTSQSAWHVQEVKDP